MRRSCPCPRSSKDLCKGPKENPNAEGSSLWMSKERSQVRQWREEAVTEVAECSFARLVGKAEAERAGQDELDDARER